MPTFWKKLLVAAPLVLSSVCSPTALATAELDSGGDLPRTTDAIPTAPPVVRNRSISEQRNSSGAPGNPVNGVGTASTFGSGTVHGAGPANSVGPTLNSAPIIPTATGPIPDSMPADQQIYSIRLPLGAAGSVIPKIHAPAPHTPPSNAFLPSPRTEPSVEYKRPVAWRATAEAIRNQPASSSLLISNLSTDFKGVYNTIVQEAQACGWNVVSDSIPAGHILVGIPRPGEPGDDAAGWLIMAASPIDAGSTELRIKIQAKRPSGLMPAINEFMQRLQLRATGNKLL